MVGGRGEGIDNKKTLQTVSFDKKVLPHVCWKRYQRIQMNKPSSRIFPFCVQNLKSDLIPRENTVCHHSTVYFQELNFVM